MNRLLNALGLITRAEHERLTDSFFEQFQGLKDVLDKMTAKYKEAITDLEGEVRERKRMQYDLACAKLEIAAIRPDAEKWRARAAREKDRGERRNARSAG